MAGAAQRAGEAGDPPGAAADQPRDLPGHRHQQHRARARGLPPGRTPHPPSAFTI